MMATMRTPRLLAVLAPLLVLTPRIGRAVEIPITGKVAVTRANKLAKIVSRSQTGFILPTPGSGEDPTIGGAQLQLFDTAALGAGQITLRLDSTGWQGLGKPAGSKGYRYRGVDDVLDPEPKGTCKSVLLRTKVIKAVCRGTAVRLTTPFTGTEGVLLTLPAATPTSTYCAEFGGTEKRNDTKLTKRITAPAPATCPVPAADPGGVDPSDVAFLADDALLGRNNATPESTTVQSWLIGELQAMGAVGLDVGQSGDAAFRQPITLGTNILGVLPGTDLAGEYVFVGAHYDHLASCASKEPGDTVCNGATDNAAGVAEVLAIGRALTQLPAPRRSVVLAFWDREEDGLLGSAHYVANPLVPLAQTVAYVNFDIQGANLLPAVKSYTFAIGAETGGADLQALVDAAIALHTLDGRRFSHIFGQGRSDYVNFTNHSVPVVFFSDATGPCYHTNQDETAIVDFGKLDEQSGIALELTSDLATRRLHPDSFPRRRDSPPSKTLRC